MFSTVISKTKEGKRIHDQEGTYFLTLTVVNWIDIFSRVRYKEIIADSLNYCVKNKGLIIYSYVIMSNHIHLIAKSNKGNLSDVLRDFKSFTSLEIIKSIKEINESRKEWLLWMFSRAAKRQGREGYKLWQSGNGAEQMITSKFMQQKIDYIHQNPVTSGVVFESSTYKYSSAINYLDGHGEVTIELYE
jgi:REP element-mobilizing transposase RayT